MFLRIVYRYDNRNLNLFHLKILYGIMNCYNIIYIIYYYKFTVNLYRKQEFYFARGFSRAVQNAKRICFGGAARLGKFLLPSSPLYATIKMLIFNKEIITFY